MMRRVLVSVIGCPYLQALHPFFERAGRGAVSLWLMGVEGRCSEVFCDIRA